jgi:hypothetical protein
MEARKTRTGGLEPGRRALNGGSGDSVAPIDGKAGFVHEGLAGEGERAERITPGPGLPDHFCLARGAAGWGRDIDEVLADDSIDKAPELAARLVGQESAECFPRERVL